MSSVSSCLEKPRKCPHPSALPQPPRSTDRARVGRPGGGRRPRLPLEPGGSAGPRRVDGALRRGLRRPDRERLRPRWLQAPGPERVRRALRGREPERDSGGLRAGAASLPWVRGGSAAGLQRGLQRAAMPRARRGACEVFGGARCPRALPCALPPRGRRQPGRSRRWWSCAVGGGRACGLRPVPQRGPSRAGRSCVHGGVRMQSELLRVSGRARPLLGPRLRGRSLRRGPARLRHCGRERRRRVPLTQVVRRKSSTWIP